MAIIDFHSHILPAIDDGARNVETSLKMIKASKAQGVDVMLATPHFYADENRIENFLENRANAFAKIKPELEKVDAPKILLGAEVAFFEGISRASDVEKLAIEGTSNLLLEMPFRKWTDADVAEVETLINKGHFHIVVAHLERYMRINGNEPYIKNLMELPVSIQINAESLLDWHGRGRLLKMFKKNQAHLLGSDAHGMNRRPPNLMAGREILEKKAGASCLNRIDELGAQLLNL